MVCLTVGLSCHKVDNVKRSLEACNEFNDGPKRAEALEPLCSRTGQSNAKTGTADIGMLCPDPPPLQSRVEMAAHRAATHEDAFEFAF
jgi:hypothetical protein